MKRHRFYKVAACSPYVQIADPKANVKTILSLISQLDSDVQLAVFPELCLSGYTCADLFYEESLQRGCLEALEELCRNVPENLAVLVGLPLPVKNHLFNAAAFIFQGEVLGFALKTYLPNYNEFYEPRWFSPADLLDSQQTVSFMGREIPVSNKLLFEDTTTSAKIGVEICEDLWAAVPVSSMHSLAGANILCNLSASNEVVAKDEYRLSLIADQSARQYCAYIYASAGPSESTMDLIFAGVDVIAEEGTILAHNDLQHPCDYLCAELDLQHIDTDRIHFKTLFPIQDQGYRIIRYASKPYEEIALKRRIDPFPFIPADIQNRIDRCQKILYMQARGLATRLEKIHCSQVVVGLSGGLDSTLALLVCLKAFEIAGLDRKGIHAILMPGFGTTSQTKGNAQKLAELTGVSWRIVPISEAVNLHFRDIQHDGSTNIVYENSQARERTQILMDIANQVNGLVIGTGDLSELALGWCTYNGDHMSMYSVNASIPKTLIRFLIETEALKAKEDGQPELEKVLLDIVDTPISPELLPPDQAGKIAQKTEELIGSYDLHDFFIYHMLRFHEPPQKIFDLACQAFPNVSKERILKDLKTFYNRFFTQQFKRNVLPDGVKVGSVSFSPRGDWRMPSDASRSLWLKELEQIQI